MNEKNGNLKTILISKYRFLFYFTLGFKYLNLVELIFKEMIKSKNACFLLTEEDISWDDFHKETRFSDFNIMVPILYNFYHGIELVIKGLIYFEDNEEIRKTHCFSKLLECVNNNDEVVRILKKYLNENGESMPNFLKEFYRNNKSTPDRFYEYFKYPEVNLEKEGYISYSSLESNGEHILKDLEEMLKDIEFIKRGIVKRGREKLDELSKNI